MRTVLIAAASLLWIGSAMANRPQCADGLEPSLATVKVGDSPNELAQDLVIECASGEPLVLLARGTRLPASYEDSFLAQEEDAEEIHLSFLDLGLFVSRKLHKAPGGMPHMKATIRVDGTGNVTLTEWDPEEEIEIPIGSVAYRRVNIR
ncbi:MAG TPA: hypothetical protein VNM67_09555 [Thermoanaerobaculia bacterium]|jgi:hypothetical protein|nr:hypothetical protein [Thermoanaerobaculia bacterium]